jgi:hypothetical protein
MEAKINKYGRLLVNRKGKFIEQFCPYKVSIQCTHDCPLFYEFPASNTVILGCVRGKTEISYRIIEDGR